MALRKKYVVRTNLAITNQALPIVMVDHLFWQLIFVCTTYVTLYTAKVAELESLATIYRKCNVGVLHHDQQVSKKYPKIDQAAFHSSKTRASARVAWAKLILTYNLVSSKRHPISILFLASKGLGMEAMNQKIKYLFSLFLVLTEL